MRNLLPSAARSERPRAIVSARSGVITWQSAIALIVAAAVLTPAVTITSRLPDIRIEQVLALPALALLAVGWRRGEGTRRLSLVDAGFAALALATAASILYASAVLREPFSPRDGYEVVKLGLYWVLFRSGVEAGRSSRGRRAAVTALLTAGSVSAALALAQYFDWMGVGSRFGGWWAPAQHLRDLARDGRAFGTFDNPNYFGALMAFIVVMALAVAGGPALMLRFGGSPLAPLGPHGGSQPPFSSLGERELSRRLVVLAWPALCFGALGLVLSGSRAALAALAVAVVVVWLVGLAGLRRSRGERGNRGSRDGRPGAWSGWWRGLRGLFWGTAALAAAFAVSVALVEAAPRGRVDYLSRVASLLSPTSDSDFALRLERWRSGLGIGNGAAPRGGGTAAHTGTGRAPADPEARARDRQRKQDVGVLVDAIRRYRTVTGALPAGPALDALVPSVLDALPADPGDGSAYRYERTETGFTVAARLEDPADPDYPRLAAGDAVNYLRNGSVETSNGSGAADFRALPGTSYDVAPAAALYGDEGIVYRGNPARRAAVYQQRHLVRSDGRPLTASVWVKLTARAEGDLSLYTNVYYADGDRQDPYARVAADPSAVGVWQRLTLTIMPDPGRSTDFIGVYLLSDGFTGEAYADGFELVDGSLPVTFAGLPEAGDAALGGSAAFRRSPVLGVGPQKAAGETVVDNEYLLVAGRYGAVGLAAYLLLWGGAIVMALRAFRRGVRAAAAIAAVAVGLLIFDLAAGSLYHLQLMGVFWPVAGALLASDA